MTFNKIPPRFALAIALALLSPFAFGQTMYRCVDAAGKITFTDNDCSGVRAAIKVQSNSIGDGGAKSAKIEQAAGEKSNAIDLAMRRYRDANDRVNSHRAALDNNDSNKRAEVASVLAEQQRCRFHSISTRRCIELDAMRQGDIDNKYHEAWMQNHRAWLAAMSERSESSKALYAAGGKPPE